MNRMYQVNIFVGGVYLTSQDILAYSKEEAEKKIANIWKDIEFEAEERNYGKMKV